MKYRFFKPFKAVINLGTLFYNVTPPAPPAGNFTAEFTGEFT